MGRPPSEEPLKSRSFRLEESVWDKLGPDPRRMLQELARAYAHSKPGAKLMKRPTITPPPAEPSTD